MNFEDMIDLFGFNTYNRNKIRMDLDEAVYLYKLIKHLDQPKVVELGTYLGGSTVLMAGAGGYILTVDNYSSKTFDHWACVDPAGDVYKLLKKYNLQDKVDIQTANTHIFPNTEIKCDVLFIDGDHSYEGVKMDYIHWIDCVKKGGHILFHDAVWERKNATGQESVAKFLSEVPYKLNHKVGSLAHFIKR